MTPKPTFSNGLRTQALTLVLLVSSAVLMLAAIGFIFARGRTVMEGELKERLRAMATLAAMQFDGADIQKIASRQDVKSDAYLKTARVLQQIMDRTPNVSSVYILRRTKDPRVLAFVADPSALLSDAENDKNRDGVIETDEVAPLPGDLYDTEDAPAMREAFLHPTTDEDISTDQWGSTISGYAPVQRRDNGKIVAIIGLDMDARDFLVLSQSTFSTVLLALLIIGGGFLSGSLVLFFIERRVDLLRRLEHERAGLLLLTSHQLGQPLTIFKLSVELLQEAMDHSHELRKAVEDHVDNMHEGIFRMNNLLVLLKEAARVEDNALDYHPAPVRLREVLEAIRTQCEIPLQRKLQKLEIDIAEDAPLYLDRKLFESALLQIVDNAMSFSHEGTAISLRVRRRDDKVEVIVQDQGCGIPEADLPRLFDKFVRAGNAAHMKPDGSGLGLFITKGIIERAEGTIDIKSREGEGTTVTVTLPVYKAA